MLISRLVTNFSDWLTNELKQRGITPAQLSRSANKSQAVIGRILNNEREASPETLQAIARALKLPIELIYQKAGLLPPSSADDLSDAKRQLIELAKQADEDTIDMAIAMLEAAHRQQRRKLKT